MLWQLQISHYNEKVRWALDLKGVAHERRAPLPPSHMAVALWLTRGKCATFPMLTLDGQVIGVSTTIIAALERRHPEPALYPEDPDELNGRWHSRSSSTRSWAPTPGFWRFTSS